MGNGVQMEERGAPRCAIDSRGGKMKFRKEGEEGGIEECIVAVGDSCLFSGGLNFFTPLLICTGE